MLNKAQAEGIMRISTGLLQDKVTGMVQDYRGFLWLSTWGGLYRYDGHSFTSYRTRQGDDNILPQDRLDAVRADRHGNLWTRSFYRPYCFVVSTSHFIDVLAELEHHTGQTYNVSKIFPMKSGRVWLLTKDGKAICVSDDNPQHSAKLVCENVFDIKEDSKGRAWLLTEHGIMLDRRRVALPQKGFRHWIQNSTNTFYIATNNGRILRLSETKNGRFVMSSVKLPWSVSDILKVVGNTNGEMAFATQRSLIVTHKGRWHQIPYPAPLKKIIRLHLDSKGRYWIISERQGVLLCHPDNNKAQQLTSSDNGSYINKHDSWFFSETAACCGSLSDKVLSVPRHRRGTATSGRVLLMSQGEGLCYYNPATNSLHHIKEKDGSWHQPQVGRSFTDADGNLWLYDTNDALERISEVQTHIQHFYEDAATCCLFHDSKGNTWQATVNGVVAIYRPDGSKAGYLGSNGQITSSPTIFGIAYDIVETTNGILWVGCKDKGLAMLKPSKDGSFSATWYTHDAGNPYSLSASDIFSLETDNRGRLWIGTYSGGLNILENPASSQIKFINHKNTLRGLPTDERSQNIRSLLFTREGIMCIGTSNGIFSFKPDNASINKITPTHIKRHNNHTGSLSNNEVMQMFEDSKGNVYILSPSSGICIAKASKGQLKDSTVVFQQYNTTTGAPSDKPLSITEDRYGYIWITYPESIVKFDTSRNTHYNFEVRMEGEPRFSLADFIIYEDGTMRIGTERGYALLKTKDLIPDASTPRIAVTELIVGTNKRICDPDICDTITLESNERDISLRLATLIMSGNERVCYAYRIDKNGRTNDNNTDQWVIIGENPLISFANLNAGYHTIQIRSTNASGVWCNNIRTVVLYVKPTFWETPWAIALYILCIALAIGAAASVWAYIYRLRLIMRTQEETIKQRMNFINNVEPQLRKDKDDLIEKVRAYIDKRIDDDTLAIPDIAAEVGMSRAAFYSHFKQLTDITPQDYLTHYRIEHAKQLLSQGEFTISECAYKCGFSDPKYFSRVFKKAEGMSPSAFIEKTRK